MNFEELMIKVLFWAFMLFILYNWVISPIYIVVMGILKKEYFYTTKKLLNSRRNFMKAIFGAFFMMIFWSQIVKDRLSDVFEDVKISEEEISNFLVKHKLTSKSVVTLGIFDGLCTYRQLNFDMNLVHKKLANEIQKKQELYEDYKALCLAKI